MEDENSIFGYNPTSNTQQVPFDLNFIKETSSEWRKITESLQNNHTDNIECTQNIILNTLISIKCNGSKPYNVRR
jgi:hypothetical protein